MIPVFKPSIRRKEMDSVLTSLVSDEIGPQSIQKDLVKEFTSLIDSAGGFALREYERAIDLALLSLGLEEGSRIVLSALAPASYYRRIITRGYEPVVVDVDSSAMCMKPEDVEKAVEEGSRAIVVDGPIGFIPDFERLSELEVPLLEDVTTTVGGHDGSRTCGSYGDIVVIRMEAEDLVTAGGGTVILAKNKGRYRKLKQAAERLAKEAFLPDMNAALARIQLRELDRYFERRRELYSHLLYSVRKGRHGTPVQTGEAESVAYSFPVLVNGSLKEVSSYARKKGVESVRAFSDVTFSFIGLDGDAAAGDDTEDSKEHGVRSNEREFPNARNFVNRCLLFPLYPRLSKEQVDIIGKVLSTLP